jgi:multicomponent Na+:H+ antiporter subunit A
MQTPTLALPIVLALLGAIVAAFLPKRLTPWVAALLAAMSFGGYIVIAASSGEAPAHTPFWTVPSLGVAGGLRLDGLGALFCLLITGIGALIFTYCAAYLKDDARLRRLVVMLLLFMMAMLGAVTADDVIVLFVFWELTSLTSFFLVGYDHEKASARKAALQSLLVTAGGGLALLAGLILIAMAAGTTSLSGIIAAHETVLAHPAATGAMLLIILGCFTKSAQLPFHFWLPNAMAAPTPVSAYLHSATMVKLGIYLLARMSPLYAGVALWHDILVFFGIATAVTATVMSLRVTDLKGILAYTTVAGLGILTALLGLGTGMAIVAAITFLVVHALYKAALFMMAGIMDHETGLRDATRLRGLRRCMPLTAATACLAALSMAGLPPFLGFVAKELVYETVTSQESFIAAAAIGMFVINAGTVAIAAVLSLRLFFGQQLPTPVKPHDPPWPMLAGPVVLSLLGLGFSLWLGAAHESWLGPAARATMGAAPGIAPALWHGFTPVLALSAITVVTGLVIFRFWPRIGEGLRALAFIDRYGPSRIYEAWLSGLTSLAHATTSALQHGSLRGYLRLLFLVAATALLVPLFLRDGFAWPAFSLDLLDVRYLVFAGAIAGALAASVAPTAFGAVIAAGLVGFCVALVFMLFGAPDVAFTQFSVETLMVVVLATTLTRLPLPQRDRRTPRQKGMDAAIAIVVGIAVTAVLLAILATPLDLRLSQWFGENSLLAAHGRNIVNVILVDFRALDTLGETTVLALAAFAVHALLRAGGEQAPATRPHRSTREHR